MVNLVTAMVAASVVYMFQHTIEQVVILASIMPIIAGMGGNAGTQALAVTVRRIALSDGPLEQKSDAVVKEMLVGLVNGAAIGVVVAVVATALGQTPILGLVVLLAMWGNIVVAGFAGAFIPTLLDRLGVDPAVASSVFVTTLTDLCGFFFLLGLATALLL
jgi:magnesium transporter